MQFYKKKVGYKKRVLKQYPAKKNYMEEMK